MSERELARRTGLTAVSISRYIHGTRTPSLYNAYRVLTALRMIGG